MGLLLVLPVLILPFVFYAFRRRAWARVGLAAVWLTCAAGAWGLFRGAADMDAEQLTVHRYELPTSPGSHIIEVRRLSQGSMLGVLQGGEGRPAKKDLERLGWSMPADLPVTWFDIHEREPVAVGETPLFRVDWPMNLDPVRVTYQVSPADAGLLASRVLVVRHDFAALHLLRDHGSVQLRIVAWLTGVWGAIWLGVQVAVEASRFRRSNVETPSAP